MFGAVLVITAFYLNQTEPTIPVRDYGSSIRSSPPRCQSLKPSRAIKFDNFRIGCSKGFKSCSVLKFISSGKKKNTKFVKVDTPALFFL